MDKLYLTYHISSYNYFSQWRDYIYTIFELQGICINGEFDKIFFICRLGDDCTGYTLVEKKTKVLSMMIELYTTFTFTEFGGNTIKTISQAFNIFEKNMMFRVFHG